MALVQDYHVDVLQCIERGLSTFGESVLPVVYWNFEQQRKLDRKEICRRADLFSDSLRKMFSDRSTIIEKGIVQEIVTTFQLSNRYYLGLSDVMNELKKRYDF